MAVYLSIFIPGKAYFKGSVTLKKGPD
jgi:hypothetical protein